MPHTLIEPTSNAVVTPRAFQLRAEHLPATLMATGLADPPLEPAEEVGVHYSVDGGQTWHQLIKGGSPVVLTLNDTILELTSPMMLGVTKGETGVETGVYLATPVKP